jgi:hypothetical protein
VGTHHESLARGGRSNNPYREKRSGHFSNGLRKKLLPSCCSSCVSQRRSGQWKKSAAAPGKTSSRLRAITGSKSPPAWRTYEGFARDVSLPPAGDHALRRLKPPEGFKPGNMVWAR